MYALCCSVIHYFGKILLNKAYILPNQRKLNNSGLNPDNMLHLQHLLVLMIVEVVVVSDILEMEKELDVGTEGRLQSEV